MNKNKALTFSTVSSIIVALIAGLVAGVFVGPSLLGASARTVADTATGGGGAVTVTKTVRMENTVTKTVTAGTDTAELAGEIEIDGSSTVYPITEAVATAFMAKFP